MTSLLRIIEFLRLRAENLLALTMFTIFASFIIQIVFRYLLNLPLGWTIEYVAIAWVWTILFGFAFVLSDDEVIRLDIIYAMMPVGIRRFMDVVSNLVCAGIFAWTVPAVAGYINFMAVEKTAYMNIPFNLVFSIYLPFMASVIVRCLWSAWQAIQGTHPRYELGQAAESHDYD